MSEFTTLITLKKEYRIIFSELEKEYLANYISNILVLSCDMTYWH